MLRVYISGPMTGVKDFNHPAFHAAEARWRLGGWDVVNPVELDDTTHKSRYTYMRQDIKALMDCDAIAMLPGWQKSEGAQAEYDAAIACGIAVFDSEHVGQYVTHPFVDGYNACCTKPKYNHEDHWGDYS